MTTVPELLDAIEQFDLLALAALNTAIAGRLARLAAAKPAEAPEAPAGDELLTVAEVAPRLGKSASWVYHHWRELPFAVAGIGKSPRFSRRGLDSYIAKRRRC